jgi:mannosyltransferase OCH1-like enzyme
MLHDPTHAVKGLVRTFIALGIVSLLSFSLYALYFTSQPVASAYQAACKTQSFAPTESEITVQGATYIPASVLLARPFPTGLDEEAAQWNGTIPKIIHQSWKEDKLPSKFLSWSNSWRIRHPDWQWVRKEGGYRASCGMLWD